MKSLQIQNIEDVNVLLITDKHLNTKLCFLCECCQKKVERSLFYYKYNNCNKLYCKTCKTKNTMIEKYGSVENFYKFQQNQRESAIEDKYGVKNISSLEKIKEKKRIIFAQESVKNQIRKTLKQTCLERYGVTSFRKSEKCKEKIKQTCFEKYGTKNPNQLKIIKNKITQTMLQKYGVARISYKYIYQSQSFDSSWELAVWIWALENGKKIKREPVGIKYMFEKNEHTYFPDFEIEGKLVEVKGSHFFKEDGTMQNPFNHSQDSLFEAKHQCGLQHGVEFWGEKEMQPILEYVEEKYGKDYLKKFKN